MWFPYSLPVRWKAESERSRISEADADNTEREFLIGFYLHNKLTGDWEVELQLEKSFWVEASEQGQPLSVGYYPSDAGQLSEIICRLPVTSPEAALRYAYPYVCRVLDLWSARKGRGFAILGFRVADLKHDVRWRALPHRPSAERLELSAATNVPDAGWSVLALYREARDASSDIYRLLCCRKIIQMWSDCIEPFDVEGEADTAHQQADSAAMVVSREMLILSGLIDFYPDLEETRFDKLLTLVEPWCAWAKQLLSDEPLLSNTHDYAQETELASIANLLDLVTHYILVAQIECWEPSAEETGVA